MPALSQLEEITHRIEHETVVLQLDLATRMVKRATLELRYAGQPRLPGGAPGGGQYTFGNGATGSSMPSTSLLAAGLGRQKFSGVLVRQNYISASDASECTYYDSRANYSFTVTYPGAQCPSGRLYY